MQNKNHPPKPQKQGGLYSLNLGQNNGPFLTKDIMLTNEKSLGLLRAKDNVAKYASQILSPNNNNYSSLESYGQMSLGHRGGALEINQPQDYYDAKHKTYLNYDERYKAKQNAAENLASNTGFAENQVKALQKNFDYYKDLIDSYRKDLETMHDQIHNSNMNNIREIQPMLKEFHLNLKAKLLEGKDDNYQLQREMEQLQREKLQIQQQILFSHKRILELEKNVGIIREDQQDDEGDGDENGNYDDDQDSQLHNNYSDQYESGDQSQDQNEHNENQGYNNYNQQYY